MKNLIIILIIGLVFSLSYNIKEKSKKYDDRLSYKLEYYDNARLYKINIEKQKCFLIVDFKKKNIA